MAVSQPRGREHKAHRTVATRYMLPQCLCSQTLMQAPRRDPGRGSQSADREPVSGRSTDLGNETFIDCNLLFDGGCVTPVFGACFIKSCLGQQAAFPVAHRPANYRFWHVFLADAFVLYLDDCLAVAAMTQR